MYKSSAIAEMAAVLYKSIFCFQVGAFSRTLSHYSLRISP